jgi:flagellar biosynthesis protein FlhB
LAIHTIAAALALGWTAWRLVSISPWLPSLSGASARLVVAQVGTRMASLALELSVGFAAVAGLEYAVARWRYARQTRLTPDEHRAELREMEGDPQLRPRRRAFYARMVRRGSFRT